MATIPNGILGGIKGRVGTVSGYSRYGVDLIRCATNDVVVKATPKRQAQREKIKVCNIFTNAFKGTGFFSKTFPAYGHTGSGYNRAMGSLMNLALVPSATDVMISYPLVLISKGPLPPPVNAIAVAAASCSIQFTWSDNSGTGTARSNDKVILLAYFPASHSIAYSLESGRRGAGVATLPTGHKIGEQTETWMGFLSNDEKDASCSVYAGNIIL